MLIRNFSGVKDLKILMLYGIMDTIYDINKFVNEI